MNNIFGSRKIKHGTYNQHEVVLKYLVNDGNLDSLKRKCCESVNDCEQIWKDKANADILRTKLLNAFENDNSIAGFQICPKNSVARFMNVFSTRSTYAWILLNLNVEPLIVDTLWNRKFSVPKLYPSCGFVTIQSDNGLPLYEFYDKSFAVRLKIARNLLMAAIQFSHGIEGFRWVFNLCNKMPFDFKLRK